MILVDSHCHLDFPDLTEDEDGVLARAKSAGVELMLNIGTRMSSARQTVEVAEKYTQIFATVGVHPHHAAEEGPAATVEALTELTLNPRVVGIGESGLDFFYDHSPRDKQEEVFRRHIYVARETDLPLVIHSRDADEDMIRILRDEMANGSFKALLHCFSSGRKLAEEALDMGCYLSASGVVTFNKNQELRDIFKATPLERILIETDSPYLAPVPKRGKRNEPSYVAYTARVMADLFDLAEDEFAQLTTGNFLRLFDKIPSDAITNATEA